MRGLKRITEADFLELKSSHLLQMRGLKLNMEQKMAVLTIVASFTDAWIETQFGHIVCCPVNVASFTDAWIETEVVDHIIPIAMSHLLQMRGLKPLFKGAFERVFNVASFTGTTIYNIFCKKITGLKYLFVRK